MNRTPRFVLASLAFALALPAAADDFRSSSSEPPRWSVGLTLGTPTGLSLKRYLGGNQAFDINVGAAYAPGLRFGADYLWGLAQLLPDHSAVNLDLYVGVGPFIGALSGPCRGLGWNPDCNGDVYVGGRVPFGLEAVFRRAPLAIGIEVGPGLAFSAGRADLIVDVDLTLRLLL